MDAMIRALRRRYLFVIAVCSRLQSCRPFLQPFPQFHCLRKSYSFPSNLSLNMALEVEQKFQIDNQDQGEISSKLQHLGFQPKGDPTTFADWYFDDLSSLRLSLQDTWLRYRETEKSDGEWQLKRGQLPLLRGSVKTNSKSTVYEEIEGLEAVQIALSILQRDDDDDEKALYTGEKEDHIMTDDNITMKDCFQAPVLPTGHPHSLKPFVRLVTTRTSWILTEAADGGDSWSGNIQVDLDTTNTNYAVGEVETVVDTNDDVLEAQAVVQRIIEGIIGSDGSSQPAMGKLEHFLIQYRPNHYECLIKAGVLKNTSGIKG